MAGTWLALTDPGASALTRDARFPEKPGRLPRGFVGILYEGRGRWQGWGPPEDMGLGEQPGEKAMDTGQQNEPAQNKRLQESHLGTRSELVSTHVYLYLQWKFHEPIVILHCVKCTDIFCSILFLRCFVFICFALV